MIQHFPVCILMYPVVQPFETGLVQFPESFHGKELSHLCTQIGTADVDDIDVVSHRLFIDLQIFQPCFRPHFQYFFDIFRIKKLRHTPVLIPPDAGGIWNLRPFDFGRVAETGSLGSHNGFACRSQQSGVFGIPVCVFIRNGFQFEVFFEIFRRS